MSTTTILLREDIDNLGGRGEIVKVKAGFARNFLLPQGKASLATKGNVKQIELERSSLLKKSAQEKSTADAQAEQMTGLELVFERKAGETGTLFGSVTTMDIAEALQSKGYEIDRRKIVLREAIKETGDYTVQIKLHRDVSLDIPVSVTAEGGTRASNEAKTEKSSKATTTTDITDSIAETPAVESES
jgi:large subunit ribosomal protein L9